MASTLARFESSGFLLVYEDPVDNLVALHLRVVDACQAINYSGLFERLRRSMMRRDEARI
jgi:hypothetical protein